MEDEALCSHYGWTPDELEEQDAYKIEVFKNILIGRNKAKELIATERQVMKGLKGHG